ncbi:poly(A) RNA polymerase gld-2 homolog A isoform X2 [Scaptodrosophila lebanonensis]|uniref:Poly(A) RNA polymerase gld-2 homolog A isoform X2 n=1 Tax=Drosophila lebanonensis TaxID=7225 RepID=A0A6J2T9K9_DROLE|nr:poly(A) RNA polymerase gld-2 homolog A isoform X2 [Scaptodrosophila lebanonensis]
MPTSAPAVAVTVTPETLLSENNSISTTTLMDAMSTSTKFQPISENSELSFMPSKDCETESLSEDQPEEVAVDDSRSGNPLLNTYPRPPGGYKYSMEFLYNIGRDLAGITLNIPTPTSITPRKLRTEPPPPPTHLPLLPNAISGGSTAAPHTSSGANSPIDRFAGGGGGSGGGIAGPGGGGSSGNISPVQFIYSGYMPSAPQRRLWHAENAVWQFDRNYPFNQGYASQYGIPLMPLGFDHPYSTPQRFIYPGYYNQTGGGIHASGPGMPRSNRHTAPSTTSSTNMPSSQSAQQQQQQQQAEQAAENFNNAGAGNGHQSHCNYGGVNTAYGRPYRERYGSSPTDLGGAFHRESKTFYNSSAANGAVGGGVRFKQFEPRGSGSYQPRYQQPNGSEHSSVNGRGYKYQNYSQDRLSEKRSKGHLLKERSSNSSGSLSTSSSKSQMERAVRPINEECNSINSPGTGGTRHPQRSYRNRVRYNDLPNGAEDKTSQHRISVPISSGNQASLRRLSKFSDVRSFQPQSRQHQHSRYYQSRNMENFNYQHFLNYQQHAGGGGGGAGGGSCNAATGAMDPSDAAGGIGATTSATSEGEQVGLHPDYEQRNGKFSDAMETTSNTDFVLDDLHSHVCKQENSDQDVRPTMSHASSICGDYDDGQSYASIAPSSPSESSDSELSDASVESLVRQITVQCMATGAGAQVPNLDGPNLVPYGDMQYLKDCERKPKNGYKYSSHGESEKTVAADKSHEDAGIDIDKDDLSLASILSGTASLCSCKGTVSASGRANIIMDDVYEDELPSIMHNRYLHGFFGYTPADRFLQRADLVEMKRPPRSMPSRAKWEPLTLGIWKKFLESQQTRTIYKTKMRLWRFIYTVTMATYPRYGLYLVGSSISYFGSKCSDMDICMLACTNPNIDPRMEAVYHLQLMRGLLKNTNVFKDFNLIEARVPILRFTDRRRQVEVDINFNNSVGIRNTHLLYCYSQLEWRVRPMAITIKQWAQFHNINNAKNMTISSYSLMLMVIHFLQAGVSPPVLPCLHKLYPEKFAFMQPCDFGYVDMNEVMNPYPSENVQTLGELLLNFLHYYSVFEYGKFAISVRVGGVLPIEVCRASKAAKNDVHQWNELCIEEPFDQTNTARSVYDPETFDRIRAIFQACYRRLESTRNLDSIFDGYDGPTILAHPSVDSDAELDRKFPSEKSSNSNSELASPRYLKSMVDKSVVALWNDIGDKQQASTLEQKVKEVENESADKLNDLETSETKARDTLVNNTTAHLPTTTTPTTTTTSTSTITNIGSANVKSVAEPHEGIGLRQNI